MNSYFVDSLETAITASRILLKKEFEVTLSPMQEPGTDTMHYEVSSDCDSVELQAALITAQEINSL